MQNPAIARKYAKALFDAALEIGAENAVGANVESLASLGSEEPALLGFLLSPEVASDSKHAFIQAVFGDRLHPTVLGLLQLLVDKRRIPNLLDICTEYRRRSEEHRGIVRVNVETAYPLTEDQEARLKAQLHRIAGHQIILEKKTNPAMVGGIIVHYRDQFVDRSINRGLKQLSDALMSA